jgi:predicted double-glycine peptidase
VLGLLLAMELSQKKTLSQIRQLLFAIGAIAFAFSILLHYSLPITGAIGKAKVVNGVVLQTTSFTCAPASIATLARFVGKHPNISERDVTELTHTNRFGTSTLAEIRAIQQLGLQPKYEDGLSISDLVKTNRPALLHVRENYQGQYINHAVALLNTDAKKQIVIIANPLYSLQIKTFKEIENYWLGEAIFVLY